MKLDSMSSSSPDAAGLLAALESDDYPRVQAAIQEYLVWFRSAPRTLEEVDDARQLFESGVEAAKDHRLQIVEKLHRLTRVFDNYVPPRNPHVWHLDA
jgi:hypothetical protein